MRKLRLQLDALTVESFSPIETAAERGTVRGHASLYWEDCLPSETCPGAGWPCEETQQSCDGTCYVHTCQPGCGESNQGCPQTSYCMASIGCLGTSDCPEEFA